ncbi:MAG: hypothetical protein EHM41_00265 [Chloroflexi bacterium]|nr:MAG: hypothetical protein EHM41_00265 [Chloroflexota bacterium]
MVKSTLKELHFENVHNPADKAIVDVHATWTDTDIDEIVNVQAEYMGRVLVKTVHDREGGE